MLGTIHLTTFIISGLLLNLYPGQDTIYIISRSMSQGKKAGILSVFGISSGGLIHTLLAGLGLSAILSASGIAFHVVKIIGALYLLYLGFRTIFSKHVISNRETYLAKQTDLQIYKQGLITNLLNPKVALFFLSFLPQFINPDNNYGPLSFLFLGSIFLSTGTLWCIFVALFSAKISEKIKKNTKITFIFEKITGIIFIGLGLNLLTDKI
jgi:RhtB (resistance to homoserine/threonine) family protein